MLLARAAKHNLYIPAGDDPPAIFMPAEGQLATACPGIVHLSGRKAARR
jgi:hypothetical protein